MLLCATKLEMEEKVCQIGPVLVYSFRGLDRLKSSYQASNGCRLVERVLEALLKGGQKGGKTSSRGE